MIDYNTAYSIIASIKTFITENVSLHTLYQLDTEMQETSFDHYQKLILSKAIILSKNSFYEDLQAICMILNQYKVNFEIVDLEATLASQKLFNEFQFITWEQIFAQMITYNKIQGDVVDKLKKYYIVYPERLLKAEQDIRLKYLKNRVNEIKKALENYKNKNDTENELKYSNLLIKSNNRIKRLEQFSHAELLHLYI
jgi:hypothetical protein